jgi:hypothetical protein
LRRESFPLSATTLEILMNLQEEKNVIAFDISPPAAMLKEIRSAVLRFIEFHMEREIKSAAFLHQFCSV